jgi:hypothetical protein
VSAAEHNAARPAATSTPSRWAVRVGVYVMLLVSAAADFLLHDWLWQAAHEGRLPAWLALLPVGTFTAFVAIYSVDRWLLVTRRHFPIVRAFFQVGLAMAFLALLWRQQAPELRGEPQPPSAAVTERLLANSDAEVRAAGCELAAWRGEIEAQPRVQELASRDPSARVRTACAAAAERLVR